MAATHWDEEAIKLHLDGTFTRVTYEGKVITESVDPDFIPPICLTGRPKQASSRQSYTTWSSRDDSILWQMRLRNRPLAEIAWVLARTEDSVRKRLAVIRVRTGR